MNTIHRWFRSGSYSLLGHVDCPETFFRNRGVVIVSPFGWEDVCSYRPLRFLGKTLAENGIPVLRFDLPGTGDSSGGALDPGLFESWIHSIGDAAAELRAATGVEEVAVVGIRMGAMLALSAADRGSNIQDLVLWGPAASGRAMLRELRAFRTMELLETGEGAESAPESVPGLEIGGFLLAPEAHQALENLGGQSFSNLRGRRVLVLSRDNLPADGSLIRGLQSSGCAVQIGAGIGYANMMTVPHEAVPPVEASLTIASFLSAGQAAAERLPAEPVRAANPCDGVSESVYTVDCPSGSMFGILSEPDAKAASSEWCVLLLNSGAVRHTGPNRMWVDAARRWSARGVSCLRLDLEGIGESDGEPALRTEGLYQDRQVEQLEMVMDSLRSRVGFQKFAAIGLCSGAFWAFHAAVRRPDLRAALLLNPRLFFWDPEVDRRRLMRRSVKGLSEWRHWRRLAHGSVPLGQIREVMRIALERVGSAEEGRPPQIPPEDMAKAWAAIERHQSRVTLAFTENEPLIEEMEEEGQMPPSRCSTVRCVRFPNCGHTFRPSWAQQLVHELIDNELREAFGETTPEAAYAGAEGQYAAGK